MVFRDMVHYSYPGYILKYKKKSAWIINTSGEFKIQTRLGFGWDSRPNVKVLRSQRKFFNQIISYVRMFIRKCLFVLVILIWLEMSKFCVHSVTSVTSVKLDTTLDCRLRKPNQSESMSIFISWCLFFLCSKFIFIFMLYAPRIFFCVLITHENFWGSFLFRLQNKIKIS
jgi:hypothetical protein